MRKTFLIISLFGIVGSTTMYSCKSSSKNAVDKRIKKKRKKAGSMDCPMKDC